MTQQNPSLPSRQVIAPPRPAHATDRYDGPTALYRMYDADDQLLYIGITCNKAARWDAHRRNSPWWKLVARKELTTYPDRSAALTAELAAIRAEKPLHNVASHPSKPSRHVHLVLTEERAAKLRALAKHRGRGNSDTMYELLDEALAPTTLPADGPSTLDTAIALAQRSLAKYGQPDFGDPLAISHAHGHVTESLRILLRALGAEGADEAVRRSVDAQFPVVAAFLAAERGEQQ